MQASRTDMAKTRRDRHTFEFKQEAVRLVEAGQSIVAAARVRQLRAQAHDFN